MTTDKQRAISLLQHYLKFGLEAAGYRWDGDNQSEVADIVDSIIDAAGQAVADVILAASSAQPDALTRIAVALERIAEKLDMLSSDGVDYAGSPISAFRVDTGA